MMLTPTNKGCITNPNSFQHASEIIWHSLWVKWAEDHFNLLKEQHWAGLVAKRLLDQEPAHTTALSPWSSPLTKAGAYEPGLLGCSMSLKQYRMETRLSTEGTKLSSSGKCCTKFPGLCYMDFAAASDDRVRDPNLPEPACHLQSHRTSMTE